MTNQFNRIGSLLTVLVVVLHSIAAVVAQELVVRPDQPQGIYRRGETVGWNVEVKNAEASEAVYVVKKGGLTDLAKGAVSLVGGKGKIEIKHDETGWLLTDVTVTPGGNAKPLKAKGGALIEPETIRPGIPRPDDFDAFWAVKLKDLESVPAHPRITPMPSSKTNVDYQKITFDNIRGSHINGQIARPSSGTKFPAMLIVQWAGVYPLQKGWVLERAAEGWLVLNILAHDLPIDEPERFYQEQSNGALKDYTGIGNDDRETSYFLRMYLSCYRGAQYLTDRPDWDGRTLVVTGGSQGGLQSIVTAGLHPKITAVMANVPAGCDLSGPEAGRMPGWPMWYYKTSGKDTAKVRMASRYYDVVNFASRVKCPVLIGVGLIDTTCPSPGVYAAFNLLQGPKEIVPMPVSEHNDRNGSQAGYYTRFNLWNKTLVKGMPAPVQSKP